MLNIFITNLGKYNEGALIGEWVSLPVSDEELEKVYSRIGINEQYEETFITDYECDFGYEVDEYDNIDELNELAELAEDQEEVVAALMYFGYNDPGEIAENIDNVIYLGEPEGLESEESFVGYYFAIECGCLDIPENLICYFDFEAYGRDIMIEGNFYTSKDGSIYELAI